MKGVFSIRVFEWKILVENPCPTNADPACLRRRFTTGFRRFSLPPLFYLSRGEERRALLAMEGHLKVFMSFIFLFFPSHERKIEEFRGGAKIMMQARDRCKRECLVSRDSLQFGYFWIAGLITSLRCVLMKLVSCSLSCLDCRNRMFHG